MSEISVAVLKIINSKKEMQFNNHLYIDQLMMSDHERILDYTRHSTTECSWINPLFDTGLYVDPCGSGTRKKSEIIEENVDVALKIQSTEPHAWIISIVSKCVANRTPRAVSSGRVARAGPDDNGNVSLSWLCCKSRAAHMYVPSQSLWLLWREREPDKCIIRTKRPSMFIDSTSERVRLIMASGSGSVASLNRRKENGQRNKNGVLSSLCCFKL